MYRDKTYHVRSLDTLYAELDAAVSFCTRRNTHVRKVFLCDGDALAAPAELLSQLARRVCEVFPRLKRISLYASPRNILEKTDEELDMLSRAKLNLAYLGLETGADTLLRYVVKGNTAQEAVQAAEKLKRAGFQLSVIIMIGLGGRRFSAEHTLATAAMISRISPHFLSFLTTTPVPGTPYFELLQQQRIEQLTTRELLEQMRDILVSTAPQNKVIFRANHVSNLFPLEGILPRDKEKLVLTLERWIGSCPEGSYPNLDPSLL